MTPIRVRLLNAQQATTALQSVYRQLKPWLLSEHAFELTVRPAKRSLSQNDKFHAICEDFEKSGLEWAGRPRTAEQWKALLVSGHGIATKQGGEIAPGLEGEYVSLRESTAQMTKERSSSLIEYSLAMGAHLGVKFRAND